MFCKLSSHYFRYFYVVSSAHDTAGTLKESKTWENLELRSTLPLFQSQIHYPQPPQWKWETDKTDNLGFLPPRLCSPPWHNTPEDPNLVISLLQASPHPCKILGKGGCGFPWKAILNHPSPVIDRRPSRSKNTLAEILRVTSLSMTYGELGHLIRRQGAIICSVIINVQAIQSLGAWVLERRLYILRKASFFEGTIRKHCHSSELSSLPRHER